MDANEVRGKFDASGISVAEWARAWNFSLPLVYAVLNGRARARRGESFRIAVALGLKPAPQAGLIKLPAPQNRVSAEND